MSGTEVVGACDTINPPCHGLRHGLEEILGAAAWQRLPRAVRARFGEPAVGVDYIGEFDIVRASLLGRLLAWLCQLTVRHRFFGELFYQTGRFRAAGG